MEPLKEKNQNNRNQVPARKKKKSNIFSIVSWLWKGDVTAMENGQIL